VTERYFQTVGMTLVEGRLFSRGDVRNSPPVAVINETMARRHFPPGRALSARFQFGAPFQPPGLEVIGVVRDVRHGSLRELPRPMAFVPAAQHSEVLQSLEIHTHERRWRPVAADVRRLIAELEPRLPVLSIHTAKEQIDRSLGRERAVARLASLFGGLAVALAAIGLFGLFSYSVVRRTREIGIRVAMGASRSGLLWLVLGDAMGLAAAGGALGLLAAAPGARLITSRLYNISPTDPQTMVLAAALLLAVAALAAYVPARRAAKLDPMAALRYE
jgi:predicted permease